MIRVFKTNIASLRTVLFIKRKLLKYYPDSKVTVDLEDEDRVLRVEGIHFEERKVRAIVEGYGCCCETFV